MRLANLCGVPVEPRAELKGARRGLFDGRRIFLSPAMYRLLLREDGKGLAALLRRLEVVRVATFRRGKSAAF